MKDLFLNGTILLSFVAIINQFVRHHNLNSKSNMKKRLIAGAVSGALGCILMIFSVNVVPGVIVDFRNIPIVLASMYGGLLTSVVASFIIGLFRLLWYGFSETTILAFIFALIMGFGCPLLTFRVKSVKVKCAISTLFTISIGSLGFIYLIEDHSLLIRLLSSYSIGSVVIMLILYLFIENLTTSNRLYKKYRDESSIDFLTGLNNVRQFDKMYNDITSRIIERDERLSLLAIDIDYFKNINDTYGHSDGDLILKELGKVLLIACRDFDIVSRNGGEEFSVILLDCHPLQARSIGERIRTSVERHPFVISNGKLVNITVSIGVATYPDTTINFNDLIKEADKALYLAKQTGRNKVVLAEIQNSRNNNYDRMEKDI